MHMTLEGLGTSIHICSSHSAQQFAGQSVEWRSFFDDWGARNFLACHFRDAYQLSRLRCALAPDAYGLSRMTDEEVIAAAARRLTSGAWRAGDGAGARRPVAAATGCQPPAEVRPFDSRAAVLSTAPMASRSRAAAGTAPPRQSAPIIAEWPEVADQLAQAETLEQAARSGTPFCAICAKRRLQAEGPIA